MARTADAVVVEVEARLNEASTRSAETQFDASVNHMASSAGKAEQAITQSFRKAGQGAQEFTKHAGGARAAQMEMMHVVRAAADQFAAGTPATQIFSQHIAQVGQAAALSGNKLGALGAFLGSGWGVAVTLGVVVLSKLIADIIKTGNETDNLVEKLKAHALQQQRTSDATEIWSNTLDGLIEHLNGITEALRKANDETKTSAQLMMEDAKQTLAALKVKQLFAQTLVDIADAANQRNRQGAMEAGPNTEEGLAYQALADSSQRRLETLRQNLSRTQAAIDKAEADYRDAASRFAVEQGKIDADPVASIKRKYEGPEGLIEKTRQRLVNEKATTDEIRKQTEALAKQEAQLIKAAQARGHGPGYSGRQLSFQEARSIAEGAGMQVNSAQRPTWIRDEVPGGGSSQERLYKQWIAAGRPSNNPVAPPGTSDHEGARGRWALDIQLAPGITAGSIKKLYASKGAEVQVFPEKGHLHVTGSRSDAAAADAALEREAREAAAQRQREAQQEARFSREMRSLQDDLVDATKGRVESADQQLQLDEKAVVQAMNDDIATYQDAFKTGQISEEQSKLLIAKRQQVATAQTMALYDAEGLRKADDRRQLEIDAQTATLDMLRMDVDNAHTARERREALLRVLEAEATLERLKQEEIIATTKIGSIESQRAQAALARLNSETGARAAAIRRDNRSPGERYMDDLHRTGDAINEELEKVAVDGLERLNDGLLQAIMGTKSLTEAFRDMANDIISQLIRIAIQQLIIKPMANLLFGGGGGTDWGSMFANHPDLELTGFASGGNVTGGKPIIVGEQGPELFVPSQSGTIIPNGDMAKMGGGSSGPAQVTIRVVRGEMFEPIVESVAGPVALKVVAATAPKVTDIGAAKTVSKLGRPHL